MNILILGGGYAGLVCATRLARRLAGAPQPAQITLVNTWDRFVERIRLHQMAAGQRLHHRPLDRLTQRAGVRLVVGRADTIDLERQTVRVGTASLRWDRLVLALGSHAGRFDVPGAAEHAFSLDAVSVPRLLSRLQSLPAQARVTIVGAGLTGVEAAAEIAEAFPRLCVQLVSRGLLLQGWSEPAREHVRRTLVRLGVELCEGVGIAAVASDHLLTSQGLLASAACIWTAGFELPPLARESGLAVTADGRVRVDPQLRSISHPRVYAAGDLAAPVLDPGQPLPMGCKSALPSGAHVAENLAREAAGEPPEAFDYALPFYCVSLGRHDGLIQWPDAEGRLLGRVMTGPAAAQFKESVCSTTWRWLIEEATGMDGIRWQRTGHAPQRLPNSLDEVTA